MSRKQLTTVAFTGTPGQEAELRAAIAQYRDVDGPLMPVLNAAQGIYGYLPVEVQSVIAAELDIPLETIYGVISFYSQFTLNPKGKFQISVCMGTACYVKGAAEILEALESELKIEDGGCTADGVFSLDATRCLGCCGLAPVMTVNDDVYGKVTAAEIPSILNKYR